jgi:hypothetical protein
MDTSYTGNFKKRQPKDKGITLQPYTVFPGIVVGGSYPSGYILVETRASKQPLQCVYAGSIMSSFLGINTSYTPPKFTEVTVLYTGTTPSYILGCVPQKPLIPQGQNKTVVEGDPLGSARRNSEGKIENEDVFSRHMPPTDMLEGELDMSNVAGVGITFLRHLMMMKAGDLAKVECHLLEDMVRIVSDKFKHHTAIGDFEIHNDLGKLNAIWHATDKDYESYGLEEPQGKVKVETAVENNIDPDDAVKDRWNHTLRSRFSKYVGYLGDFIHLFVTDPTGHLADIAESSFPAGKFRAHVNNDGSLLVQSVADIAFEKVVKIVVPVPKKRYDDPDQAIEEDLDPEPMANWIPGDDTKLFETAYQLRDYSRWFSNLYSLAKFHMKSREYHVPDPKDVAEVEKDGKDPEKNKANGSYGPELHTMYMNRYACIRIMRDGSVVAMDAYGSAINMSGGDVSVSSARNLNLEAANHVFIKAGNDVIVKARRSIEMSAVVGGILTKSKAYMQSLCEAGSIVLESFLSDSSESDEVEARIVEDSGLVLKAKSAKIAIESKGMTILSMAGELLMNVKEFLATATKFKVNRGFEVTTAEVNINGRLNAQVVNALSIPGWACTLPSGFPTPIFKHPVIGPIVFPPVEAILQTLQSEDNASQDITSIEDVFSYNEEYTDYTEYESITQQHLRLDNPEGYESFNDSNERAGSSVPYPGVGMLGYNPTNQKNLDDDSDVVNKSLKNTPNTFTNQSSYKYYKPQ